MGRAFTDLDGRPSVTCVPATPPVDFAAGGLELPDACAAAGAGTVGEGCVDVGGFPASDCPDGQAAVLGEAGTNTVCSPEVAASDGPGARDFSAPLEELRVCSAPPPRCGRFGWLVKNQDKDRQGVICPRSIPDLAARTMPEEPTCDDVDFGGGGFSNESPGERAPFDPDTEPIDETLTPADLPEGGVRGPSGCDGCASAWAPERNPFVGALLRRR